VSCTRPDTGAARLVELRLGRIAFLHQVFLARELRARELHCGLRLVHGLAQRRDLRRTARGLQVLEPRLRALQPLLRLAARRALVLLLEREHRLPGLDLIAAAHVKLLQLPGVRRGEHHVLAFDVSLQGAVVVLLAGRERDHA